MRCFGADRDGALAFRPPAELADTNAALQTMAVELQMAADLGGAALVHSHTWYANFAGHVAKLLHGVPHVATAHSLEPMRPWKEEQLGGGYRLSSFCERTALESADAVVAVSAAMRDDVLASYPALDPARLHVIAFDPSAQIVLAAGVPDTEALAGEIEVRSSAFRSSAATSSGSRGCSAA